MVSCTAIMIGGRYADAYSVMINIGGGINGMFETSLVAALMSVIITFVIEYSGFEAVLRWVGKMF